MMYLLICSGHGESPRFETKVIEAISCVIGKEELQRSIYDLGVIVVGKGGLGTIDLMRMLCTAEIKNGDVGVESVRLGLWIQIAERWKCEELRVYLLNVMKAQGEFFVDFGGRCEKVVGGALNVKVSMEEISRIVEGCADNEEIKKVIIQVPDLVERLKKPFEHEYEVPNMSMKRKVNSVLSLNAFGGLEARRASVIVADPVIVAESDAHVSGVSDLRGVLVGDGGDVEDGVGGSNPWRVFELLEGLEVVDPWVREVQEEGLGDVGSYKNPTLSNL
jgi:hypothetical protein